MPTYGSLKTHKFTRFKIIIEHPLYINCYAVTSMFEIVLDVWCKKIITHGKLFALYSGIIDLCCNQKNTRDNNILSNKNEGII